MITKKKLGTDTTANEYYLRGILSDGERYTGPDPRAYMDAQSVCQSFVSSSVKDLLAKITRPESK